MLDRYRKPGGFNQLLLLLETCGTQKQQRFMSMIVAEDPRWSDELQIKLITFEKIMGWRQDVLNDIISSQHDITLSVLTSGEDSVYKDMILTLIPHGRQRKIADLANDKAKPTAAEVATMIMKVVESTRKMAIAKEIRLEEVDPALVVPDGIEEMLSKRPFPKSGPQGGAKPVVLASPVTNAATAAATATLSAAPAGAADSAELSFLRNRVNELQRENAKLRHDLSTALGKLEQIKKIA